MVRITGRDILRAREFDDRLLLREIAGDELFDWPSAAHGEHHDSSRAEGYEPTKKSKIEAVPSREASDGPTASPYCIKISGDGHKWPVTLKTKKVFHLEGGGRYRISCNFYSAEQETRVQIAAMSDLSYSVKAMNTELNRTIFDNTPGQWTRLTGTLTMPDVGDHEAHLRFLNLRQAEQTWYIDDISMKKLELREDPDALEKIGRLGDRMNLSDIKADRVNLYCQGETVPIIVEKTDVDGRFGVETEIIFWGESLNDELKRDNPMAEDNVYVLVFASDDPPHRFSRAEGLSLTDEAPPLVESHRRLLHLERDRELAYYRSYAGRPTDRVMWTYFKSPPRSGREIHLDPLGDLVADGSPAVARMLFWGFTYLDKDPDHEWTVRINDAPIGGATWDGRDHYVFEAEIDPRRLHSDRRNLISLVNEHEDRTIDQIALDWIEIEYDARFKPEADFVAFDLPAAVGPRMIRLIDDFSGGAVRLFDLTRQTELEIPSPPRPLKGRGYMEFPYPGSAQPVKLAAVGPAGLMRPEKAVIGYPTRLRDLARSPQYVIVTHRKFMGAAGRLIEHRRGQGLSTLLVDVEDVYDEYNHGIISADALKHFFDDLIEKSADGASGLRYVFLIGDATFDSKGIVPESMNYVPTHHVVSGGRAYDYTPTYAHDDYFVLGNPVGKTPRVAIGRLPISGVESLNHYIDKLVEYETEQPNSEPAPKAPNWRDRALLIGAEGFAHFCEGLARESLAGWDVEEVYAREGDVASNIELQNRILKTIDKGAGVVYFVGHGAYFMWRTGPFDSKLQSDMFNSGHVARLTNRPMYPIVLTSTCFSNLYDAPINYHKARRDNPSASGIGIYMVEAPRKGAIACIGHVGKITAAAGHLFCREVLDALGDPSTTRLGDAFLGAKSQFTSNFHAGMALIGDPAIRVGARYHREVAGGELTQADAKR